MTQDHKLMGSICSSEGPMVFDNKILKYYDPLLPREMAEKIIQAV
jgi:hypothetical protein